MDQATLSDLASRAITLGIAVVIAIVVIHLLEVLVKRLTAKMELRVATIFINLVRGTVWVIALLSVLEPVFNIQPTAFVTALGVTGVAISLGLQDTVSNVIGGMALMTSRVIQPGDWITAGSVTGKVTDITWRQTVMLERNGNKLVIPNSVLNTSALERVVPANESCVDVPFTIKAGTPVDDAERWIITRVRSATADMATPSGSVLVRFSGFSPYGIEGSVLVFAAPGVPASTIRDATVRALASADFIEQRAAIGQ